MAQYAKEMSKFHNVVVQLTRILFPNIGCNLKVKLLSTINNMKGNEVVSHTFFTFFFHAQLGYSLPYGHMVLRYCSPQK